MDGKTKDMLDMIARIVNHTGDFRAFREKRAVHVFVDTMEGQSFQVRINVSGIEQDLADITFTAYAAFANGKDRQEWMGKLENALPSSAARASPTSFPA